VGGEPAGEEGRTGAYVLDLRRQQLFLQLALRVEREPLDLGVDVSVACDQAILNPWRPPRSR